MNVRHPMGVLHSFSIKNIFYDKMDLRLFYFDVAFLEICKIQFLEISITSRLVAAMVSFEKKFVGYLRF